MIRYACQKSHSVKREEPQCKAGCLAHACALCTWNACKCEPMASMRKHAILIPWIEPPLRLCVQLQRDRSDPPGIELLRGCAQLSARSVSYRERLAMPSIA